MQHTIPRLELCAAALAIQVDATLTREITADIDLQSSVYWTDSMIVLAYLQDDSKRYHTFVGNRVARIRSHSEASQWHNVPSEQNPADLASRGTISVAHLASSEWFNGPKFLAQQESEWPSCDQLVPVLDSDVEVKRNVISHMVEASMPSMILMKLIEGQNFNDDLLETFLVQCEATVNQRPLVKATDDPTDDTTLRPCDLLLLHQKRPIPILGIKVEFIS